MTLNSILDVAMPIAIFAFLFGFIYFKAKKPIDTFFACIKNSIQNTKEKAQDIDLPMAGSEIYYG